MSNITVIKSGIWYTFSTIIVKGLAFITVPIFTRMMSKGDFGEFSNYTAWLHIFVIIVSLNMGATIISAKYDYKDSLDKYIFSVLVLSSISAFFFFFCVLFFSSFFVAITGIPVCYLYLLCLYILFFSPIEIFQIKQRYTNKYKLSVFISVSLALMTLIISIVLVYFKDDKLEGRIWGMIAPTILIGLIIYLIIWKDGKKISTSCWRYAIPLSLPYIPHLLSLILLSSMDKVMITNMCGAQDNAVYSVAYTGGQIIVLLVTSLNMAYSPWLGDRLNEKQYDKIRKSSYLFVSLFLIFAIGLMLFTPEALWILGGSGYSDATKAMAPVSMACICQFLYTMFVNIEQFEKKTIWMALGTITAAGLNYILNFFLIPIYGFVAASYTTLASYIWLLMVHMIIVKRMNLSHVYDYRFIFLILFSMILFTIFCSSLYENINMRVCAILIYFLFLLLASIKYRFQIKNFIFLVMLRKS